jgi:hypothetical protein
MLNVLWDEVDVGPKFFCSFAGLELGFLIRE